MAAARKSSRYGHRDATMILIGYRATACGRPSCAICNGRRLSWPPAGYTCAGRRTARRVSTTITDCSAISPYRRYAPVQCEVVHTPGSHHGIAGAEDELRVISKQLTRLSFRVQPLPSDK